MESIRHILRKDWMISCKVPGHYLSRRIALRQKKPRGGLGGRCERKRKGGRGRNSGKARGLANVHFTGQIVAAIEAEQQAMPERVPGLANAHFTVCPKALTARLAVA